MEGGGIVFQDRYRFDRLAHMKNFSQWGNGAWGGDYFWEFEIHRNHQTHRHRSGLHLGGLPTDSDLHRPKIR